MGGFHDTVEGKTKIATWKAFEQEVRRAGLWGREAQDSACMWIRFPTTKQEAYHQMVPKADGSGWTLVYRFHKLARKEVFVDQPFGECERNLVGN